MSANQSKVVSFRLRRPDDRPETAAQRIVRESHTPPQPRSPRPRPRPRVTTVRFEITLGDMAQMSRDLVAVGVALGKAVVALKRFWRQRGDATYETAAQAAVAVILREAAQKANAYRRNIPHNQSDRSDQMSAD